MDWIAIGTLVAASASATISGLGIFLSRRDVRNADIAGHFAKFTSLMEKGFAEAKRDREKGFAEWSANQDA